MDAVVHRELRELEESLWRPETRYDGAWMRRVLHPEFREFGRSGRVYDLAATLANRSSLWTRGADGWRLRFHQGTPVTPIS